MTQEENKLLATELVFVPACATMILAATPQMPFRPTYCVVTTPHLESFMICDILIGMNRQFAAYGPVLASAFAPMPSFEGCSVPADFDKKLEDFMRQVRRFDFDPVLVNQPIFVTVENLDQRHDMPFQMVFWGKVIAPTDFPFVTPFVTPGGSGDANVSPGSNCGAPEETREAVDAKKVAVLREMLDRGVAKK